MSEVAVRRADIWIAKLPYCEDDILQGVHPILIISCKTSNSCTNLVNIVPITSTLKSNITNIPIGVESGLLHDSVLLCGQVNSINQKNLIRKVGFVSPNKMDLVVKTIIKQFSGKNTELNLFQKEKLDFMFESIKKLIGFKIKYNITDAEIDSQIESSLAEIKNYCNSLNYNYENWGNLEMFKVYQEKRREIRTARGKKDFKLTAQLSEEYLTDLYEMDYAAYGKDIYQEFEWAYYNLALSLKKIGEITRSFDLAKQSLSFSLANDSNFILTNWLLGELCCELGENFKDEGVCCFDKCIKFYHEVGEKKYEILSRFNKYKILRHIPKMKQCIEEYEATQFKNVLHTFGDMENAEVIKQLKLELAELL